MRTLKHVIFSEPIGSVLKIYGLQKLQYFKAIDKQITSENKQMPAMLQPVMCMDPHTIFNVFLSSLTYKQLSLKVTFCKSFTQVLK